MPKNKSISPYYVEQFGIAYAPNIIFEDGILQWVGDDGGNSFFWCELPVCKNGDLILPGKFYRLTGSIPVCVLVRFRDLDKYHQYWNFTCWDVDGDWEDDSYRTYDFANRVKLSEDKLPQKGNLSGWK